MFHGTRVNGVSTQTADELVLRSLLPLPYDAVRRNTAKHDADSGLGVVQTRGPTSTKFDRSVPRSRCGRSGGQVITRGPLLGNGAGESSPKKEFKNFPNRSKTYPVEATGPD